WSRTARADLEAIVNHIAAESIDNALAVLGRLEKKAESLNAQSGRGRVVPELQDVGINHYHELISKPWRIIYRLESERVLIMAILDSRRDLEDLLLQRLTRMPAQK
ncbi:MAG: type II toxin-antitoxin system RelE/ParE family toxin, partial [Gammaproteobacteria bacterium]|nr:type II toxin-antitoxin system RelE/ParE family toxin [Gammaproteobacteria bacterium]